MAINWDLAYSSAKKLDEEKEKEISKRKKVEPTTNGTNKSTGSKANPSFSNEEEKKAYVENSKVSSSRAGIESESNISAADEKARKFVNANRGKETAYLATAPNARKYVVESNGGTVPAITPAVNASVAERNAARSSAKKENTEKKFKQPGNSGQLPGDARTQNGNTHVEIDESKNKAEQISELNERIKDKKYYKSDIQKNVSAEKGRKRVLAEYTEMYNNMSTDAKRLLSLAAEGEDAEEYAKFSRLAGIENGDGITESQIDKRTKASKEARKKLRELYGMSDYDIDAVILLNKRAKNAETAKRQEEQMRQIADEHPFISSVMSVPLGVVSDIMPFFEMADSFEERQKTRALGMAPLAPDENNMYSALGRGRDTLQSTVSENINKKYGEFASTTYSAVMSGITNAAEGAVFGKATEAVLSINAGVGAYKNARARGLSDEECLKTAAVAIAAEFIGEHIGSAALRSGKKVLGKTFREIAEKSLTPDTFGKFLLTTAKNAGSNAGEEVLTSIINKTYDYFANGELSEYQLSIDAYMADGSSEEEAIKKAKSDIAKSLLNDAYAGAVTGLMFNAPNAVSYGMGQASIAATGKYAKQEGLTPSVIAAAKEAPQGSKPNKLAGKAGENKSGKISSYTVGKIAKANSDFYNAESTGRFSNVKTEAELEERYQSAIQMKKDKGSDSVKQIQKEYEQAKARIRMQAAAKAEADKFEGAQKTERKANELTRIEITNPTIEVDGKRYSIEGKNFDGKTEEIGDAQTIFKDADGDNAVRFGDGQTMKVSEAVEKMTDETAKEVYKATEGMSPEAANLFISNYDGDTVPEYKRAFEYYYNMGKAGASVQTIREHDGVFGAMLTADAQQRIAEAGLKDKKFKNGITDWSIKKKTPLYKFEKGVLQAIGEKFGTEFIILDESSDINAKYLTGTNRIVIYRNADGGVMLRSAAHETYHFVENYSAKDASDLREYVIDALKVKGVDIDEALEKYAKQGYATREEQISELVADSMFDVFSNEDFIKNLTTKNQTLAKRLANHIGELVKQIREAVKMLSVRYSNPEIKALMNDAEKLDTIRNMLLEGYKNAGENFKTEQRKGQKNNTDGTAVKYSKKYNQFENNKDIINLINKVKSRQYKDNESVELGVVSQKAAKEIEKILGIDVSGFKVAIEARQIFHILNDHGAKGKADHSMENDEDIAKMEYVLNNFDEISFSGKTQAYSYMKDGFNRTAETVLYEKNIGNKSYYVVQAVPNTKKKTLYIVSAFIGLQGYKNGASQLINTSKGPNATAKTGSVVTPNSSIPKTIKSVKQNLSESDAKYLEAIENGDTETVQRIVDEAAKTAGYEYKLYHQTGNDFTVFDTKHIGAGTGDSETPFGIFMKPTSANIGLKGQKQMPVYAAIKKPLVVRDRENLLYELNKNETVKSIQDEINRVNADYKQRVDQTGKDLQNYLIEYRKKHPDEPRSEIYNDEGFNEIYEREDSLIDEWSAAIDMLSLDSKDAITDYLRSQGYDSVILKRDAGSFGRETQTYIALDNTQVKSADPVTYDDNGDVIPLSERFKSSNVDIRYSMKQEVAEQKQKQLNIINETNPAPNTYSTWIRTVDDIKTLAETLEDDEWGYEEFNPDLTRADVQDAIESGEITVYSSYPIKNGVFVSPSRMEAESYSGDGKVYEKTVDINDVAWIDPTQGQYAKADAVYSKKQNDPIQAHFADVIRENRHWRVLANLLTDDAFAETSKDLYIKSKDVHKIAKEILNERKSKYDIATFENQLMTIFEYIKSSGKDVDAEAVSEALYKLCYDVLNQSEIKDTELYDQYADVRKFLHDTHIYFSENVRKETISQFGDFKSFRNKLMGKMMHITTTDSNARSLDEVWQELSEMAPEYFPKDMNELDMPMQLTRFFEIIAPKTVNPYKNYEINIADEAAILADVIFEKYKKIKLEKTDKGKAKEVIEDGIKMLEESRAEMQKDFDRKKLENAEEYRKRLAEHRKRREEGDRKRVLKNQLERNCNYLNRRLIKETDKDHIPENLKPLVSSFRKIVPDSNKNFSKSKFAEFENEYRKLENKSPFFDSDMADKIGEFARRVTLGLDAPKMRELNNAELQSLRDISEHIKYIVQNENRLFSEGLNGRVEEFGKSVHNELFEKKDSKDQGVPERGAKKTDIIRNGVNRFIKGLTKPEYLFEGIGSPTVKALYDELRKGENIEAKIVYDAKLAEQEIKKRNNYDQRWETQTVTLDLRSGKRNVTIEDVMALYATSRRKQGLEHMLNGGVVIYSQKDIAKNGNRWVAIKKGVIKNAKKNDEKLTDLEIVERTNNIYNDEFGKTKKTVVREQIIFNKQDISLIEKVLTNDQKNYVNDMVEYITKTIGEKRNEVSMKLYGIEKYKESFYFPIKVDRNFVDTSVGKQEVVSTIKNQSSSKRTVDHARNPIEITGFTDTVNNHVLDSALYCAYVLPINDFKRVYNYREKVYDGDGVESLVPGGVSVKSDIERTSGVNAIKEIERFMISLDSGSRYENLMPFSAKLMARTKKTAVMANLSVVVQQPTAVFRAMLYISPKHFATWANKADIEEMKRWNGCALKKEIGYFDVNMGRSATDYMNEYSTDKSIKEDWSLSDKVKNSNTMLKIDQAAGFLASKADEQTWGAIWKACKKQVKAENPELSGDSLNAAAAELFQTTISKTQVYDSVFTKPEYMRRKEGFAMMATQFMSEPLTSLNMLAESVAKAKNTEKGSQQRKDALKFSVRAFGCYITSVVVNSALKGIIYAMRDDDEDETFLEKYISNVAESIPSDILGMVPYFKDILSVVQGYDLNRADVAVFTTMADAIKDLGSDNKTTFEKIMSVMKAAGQASGIPVYNVMRDAKSIIDIAIKIKEGVENGFPETTGRGVLNELKETFDWLPGIDAESNYEQLYSSIIKGDQKHYDRVYNSLVADGKSMSNIENGIGKVLAEKNSVLAEAFNLILADKSVEASGKIQELKNAGFSNEIINNALSTYKTNLKNDLVENEEKSEDNRIKQAAFARYDMDYTLYESLVDELVADGYNETIVREAIDSEKVELEKAASEFSLNEKDEYTGTYDMRNALQKNNFDNFESVYKKIAENSGESEAKKNAKSEIKKAYKDGHISEGKAGELLKEYVDSDYSDTDVWKELYKAKSSRNSIYDKMYDAIDNGGNFSIDYLLEQGIEKDDIAGQIATYAKPKLLEMEVDSKEYNEMYENILDAYVTVGKTEAYGASRIRKWHSDAAKAERKKNMRK